jgi:hypothetical protein
MKRYGRYDARSSKPEIKDRVPILFTVFAALLGGIYVIASAFLARENPHPGHVTMMWICAVILVLVGQKCLKHLLLLAQVDILRTPPDLLEQKHRLSRAYRWTGIFAAVVGFVAAMGLIPDTPLPDDDPGVRQHTIGPN